jgi:hypothetical protein
MSKLNVQEILRHYPELAQLGDEEQVNVNHVGCPAGADRKRRLYVRKRDGKLLMFCHHCQGKGAKGGAKRHIRDRVPVLSHWKLALPPDYTGSLDPAGRAWLNKYGIGLSEQLKFKIGWSPSRGRVILPIYQDGELVAYQARRVLPYDTGPKYLTDKRRDVTHPTFLRTDRGGNTLVLTEDILSAIVVGRVVDAAALLGVGLDSSRLYRLLDKGYTRFVVVMDDDNAEVRKQQRAMQRLIGQYADVKVVKGHETDPKEWTEQQIQEAIK